MSLFIYFLVFIFLVVFLGLAKSVVLLLEEEADAKILDAQQTFEELLKQKEQAVMQRSVLERQANTIFSLYEMTKEINEKLSQDEAFYIFRAKLREHAAFFFQVGRQLFFLAFEGALALGQAGFLFPQGGLLGSHGGHLNAKSRLPVLF